MNRFSKKGKNEEISTFGAGLAMPDWLAGKRRPQLFEIERFIQGNCNRKPSVNKALIRVLMDWLVEKSKQDSICRAKITSMEKQNQAMPTEIAVLEGEIERLQREIDESQRYRMKLLNKIEPLESELRMLDNQDTMSIQSTSERSLKERKSLGRTTRRIQKQVDVNAISKEVIPVHEQNELLSQLTDMYQEKLEILRNKFYDKEVLEYALQRFINSDCIEYKEYGIEAYEILTLHEKLLQVTLAEKLLGQQVELSENMKNLPLIEEKKLILEKELSELTQIMNRQKKILKSSRIDPWQEIKDDQEQEVSLKGSKSPANYSELRSTWLTDKDKIYWEKPKKIPGGSKDSHTQSPLKKSTTMQSYSYTNKAQEVPEFQIRIETNNKALAESDMIDLNTPQSYTSKGRSVQNSPMGIPHKPQNNRASTKTLQSTVFGSQNEAKSTRSKAGSKKSSYNGQQTTSPMSVMRRIAAEPIPQS